MLVINNALMCDVSTVCRLFLIDGHKLGSCTRKQTAIEGTRELERSLVSAITFVHAFAAVAVYAFAIAVALALSIVLTSRHKDWSATVKTT